MSASFNKYFVVTVTAAGGLANSAPIKKELYQDMVDLLVSAPATLVETVKFQVGDTDDGGASTNWTTLQDDTAADVAGPAAGKCRVYTHLVNARVFRILLSGVPASDRAFHFSGQWTNY